MCTTTSILWASTNNAFACLSVRAITTETPSHSTNPNGCYIFARPWARSILRLATFFQKPDTGVCEFSLDSYFPLQMQPIFRLKTCRRLPSWGGRIWANRV